MTASAPPRNEPLPEQRAFRPYGTMRPFAVDYGPECLLSGPAGTGKSRMCLEKLFRLACDYPGSRHLILRKTRESLTQAALYTFEEKVVPAGHPILSGPQRNMRQRYVLGNGAEIVVGGLDKPQKVMSTEYDLAYIQEATECTEEDWEMVTTRLRNGRLPFSQLMADCNPDAPSHWLYQRCQKGQTRLYETRHEDNPTVTPEYLSKLDALTGVRYKRLRLGLWVAAEGMVYEGWDPALHRIDRFPLTPRRVVAGVDWGFTHAGVINVFALDGDGRMVRVYEIHQTRRLIDWWVARAQELARQYPIEAFVADPSEPAYIQQFAEAGLPVIAGCNDVGPGIQAVAQRLRVAEDGRPRLLFFRDSLEERDPELEDRKKPCSTEEEFDSYVWNLTGLRKKGEEPVKENDDGLDALRYAVAYVDGLGQAVYQPQAAVGPGRAMPRIVR